VLPFPVFGGITKPVLAAEWPVGGADGWRDSWRRPRLQLGLSVDDTPSSNDDGATLTSNGSLAFRRKVFVTRRWGVEVRSGMQRSPEADVWPELYQQEQPACTCFKPWTSQQQQQQQLGNSGILSTDTFQVILGTVHDRDSGLRVQV
jgi:hypothetical protein